MKKLIVILLAAAMLAGAGCAARDGGEGQAPPVPPEEPVYGSAHETLPPPGERVAGEWYAEHQGLLLTLNLSGDGTYTFLVPGAEGAQGEWFLEGGMVMLDGGEGGTLAPVNGVLRWEEASLIFRREAPDTYVPGSPRTDAAAGELDGYWRSWYVGSGDGTMLASAAGDDTDVYIEGQRVALGGSLFGDVIVDMDAQDGGLLYSAGGASVSLVLLDDGFLRLTLTGGEEPVTVYLLPAFADLGDQEG